MGTHVFGKLRILWANMFGKHRIFWAHILAITASVTHVHFNFTYHPIYRDNMKCSAILLVSIQLIFTTKLSNPTW